MIAGYSGKMPGRGGVLPTCCASPARNRGSLLPDDQAFYADVKADAD